MNPFQLLKACDGWDGTNEGFAKIVAAAITDSGATQRELAQEYEVADSTVFRWSNGFARPHPRLQKVIVSLIRRRATRSLVAQQAERRIAEFQESSATKKSATEKSGIA